MSVYPILDRLNRLTETTLDIRANPEDSVEFHVTFNPIAAQIVADCGHIEPALDHAIVVYVNLFRGGILLTGHVIIPREDMYDDKLFVRWLDRLWDSLVVIGIETFSEGEAFESGPDPY